MSICRSIGAIMAVKREDTALTAYFLVQFDDFLGYIFVTSHNCILGAIVIKFEAVEMYLHRNIV